MKGRMKLNRTPVVALVYHQLAEWRTPSAVFETTDRMISFDTGASLMNSLRYDMSGPSASFNEYLPLFMSSCDALTASFSQLAAEPARPSSGWYFLNVPSNRATRDLRASATSFVISVRVGSFVWRRFSIAKFRSA